MYSNYCLQLDFNFYVRFNKRCFFKLNESKIYLLDTSNPILKVKNLIINQVQNGKQYG